MDGMTIGALARRSGLSVSAIRFYQRRGLLPPRETTGGWQRYGADTLTRLAAIELAKRTGFTLDEIGVLLSAADTADAPSPAWKGMFHAKITEIDRQIERLGTIRRVLVEALACDCLTLDRESLIPAAFGWVQDTAVSIRADLDGPPVQRPEAPLSS